MPVVPCIRLEYLAKTSLHLVLGNWVYVAPNIISRPRRSIAPLPLSYERSRKYPNSAHSSVPVSKFIRSCYEFNVFEWWLSSFLFGSEHYSGIGWRSISHTLTNILTLNSGHFNLTRPNRSRSGHCLCFIFCTPERCHSSDSSRAPL